MTVFLVSPALTVSAGPWSQLPDAVDRLSERPGDEDADWTVRLVEGSLVREAQVGHVVATRSLFDTYASLVTTLSDGDVRLAGTERRVAERLLQYGDQRRSTDLRGAFAAWALAAEFDPGSEAADRLKELLLPPTEAGPGQTWRSPLDGSKLVFHPATVTRVGCTEDDGACRDNEIIFRWAEIPARWFETTEVTNRRYRLCFEAGACSTPEDATAFNDPEREGHPVVGVSWRQARSYARWAGRRLPSEAEWERAARGGVNTARFPWGNARRRELANIWQDPGGTTGQSTFPVGSFPATGYGLRDMAGNVWEWCQDRYQGRFADEVTSGDAVRQGWGRAVRGGSWRRAIDMARVSSRSWYDIGYFADDLGFRCVMDHNRQVSVAELVRMVQRAFPAGIAEGHELDEAQLEVEDRRFLLRRAITLFVIEDRMEEALVLAALRLASEPRDPVALDLFDRFEAELLQEAAGRSLVDVGRGLESYRRATVEYRGLVRRFESFERRMLAALRSAVQELERRGDRATARRAAELGLSLAPGDERLEGAVVRLTRAVGTTRVWPGDGKGMAWIQEGRFRFGASAGDHGANNDENPPRMVNVDGFWIDRTEVTNDEYRSCVDSGACTPPRRTEFFDNPNFGNHPVLWVDWFQARSYAEWAGKRLATEVEWEFAARAGADTAFPWGRSWIPGRANALGLDGHDTWGGTAPVASFEVSPWGLYDLIGNASEWVEDVYNETLYGMPRDGRPWHQETGLAGERRRVVRGAGYDEPSGRQRVSRRSGRKPDNEHRMVGFRCVADE